MGDQQKLPLRRKASPAVLRYSDNNNSPTKPRDFTSPAKPRDFTSPAKPREPQTYTSPSKQPQPVQLFSRHDVHSLKYGGFFHDRDVIQARSDVMPARNDVINLESVRHASPTREYPNRAAELTSTYMGIPSDPFKPASDSFSSKPSDPYSRPFIPRKSEEFSLGLDRKSSLDQDRRLHEHRTSITRIPSFVSGPPQTPALTTSGSGVSGITTISSQPSYSVQTNSFMRPKSALKKDEPPPQVEDVESENESETEPEQTSIARDTTESRSFVIFPSKSETSFENMTFPSASSSSQSTSIGQTESVIKSLQRPLSAKSRRSSDSSASESSPTKSILKSRENLYSSGSGSAIRRKVKLNTTATNLANAEKEKSDDVTKASDVIKASSGSAGVEGTTKSATPLTSLPSTISTQSSVVTNATSTTSPSKVIGSRTETAASVADRPPTPRGRSPSTSSIIKRSPTPTQVRNPRYTPTKPYDEVKDPKPQPPKSEPELNVKNHETKNNTSTHYKAIKALHEQRREGDGAPAEKLVGSEKPKKVEVSVKVISRQTADGSDNSSVEKEERLPGDGETSVENSDVEDEDAGTETEDACDDVEDDVVDNLDDDVVDFSGDDSDGISMTSSLSMKSGSQRGRTRSARTSTSMKSSRQHSATSTRSKRPALPGLTPSLFTGVPPTVTFGTQDQRIQALPWEIRKMLKWRLSPITPNIVKSTVARSGFRITKRNYDWIGCWGRHMKAQCFKTLREYQKINHFPGTFQIGRKDRLWRNLYKLQVAHGKKEFGFFPQTYVLPADLKRLKNVWDESAKQKWIIKPPASARGIGIRVIHKWAQIPKRRPVIVQKYLAKPYLINQSKFDLRIYVYVTSYDPLRIYVFEDGLVRFASQKYSSSMKHLSNKFMHLTNYSINKRNSEYQSNTDENVCQGHKWGLKALWGYLQDKGISTSAVWNSIKDVVVKCIISAESPINSLIKSSCKRRYTVHELFGFDIFLDETLKPWIIEVNISPSLHSNSQLDINIKGTMMKDLLNLAGFMIPDKREVVAQMTSETSLLEPNSEECIDKRLWNQSLSYDEKAKHAYFVSRAMDTRGQTEGNILEILTPDDLRILVETVDEDSRRGQFERVFPSVNSTRYLQYFEQPRYYNMLVDAWTQKYLRTEQRGIALLETYCQQNLHLAAPTMDPAHQWSPPNALTPRTHSAPARKPAGLQVRTSFTKKSSLKGRKSLQSMSLSSVTSDSRASTTTRESRASSLSRDRSASRDTSRDGSRDPS